MSEDELELANRLFAAATAKLEDALELSAAGQSPRLDPYQLAGLGCNLESAIRDVVVLA
jgi:hypothetical protein